MKLRTRLIAGAVTAAVVIGAMLLARPPKSTAQEAPSRAALTVSVTTPTGSEWPQTVTASGAIAAWQEVVIGAQTGGLAIVVIRSDVGAHVRKGEVLAELASDAARAELRRLEANLASARASLAQAKGNASRARISKEGNAMSQQQYAEYVTNEELAQAAVDSAAAQVDAQRIVISHTNVVAADDGIVISRSATLGKVVQNGDELFRMIRQGRLEWHAEVDAEQLAQVKPGQAAQVMLPTGTSLTGKVRVAAPSLSTETARGIVYVNVPANSGAQAGMFANGTIEVGSAPALTVPQSAVVLADGYSYVFEVGKDSRVTRRQISTGRRQGDRIEVLVGLDRAASIVASGGAFLADGDLVKVTAQGSKS